MCSCSQNVWKSLFSALLFLTIISMGIGEVEGKTTCYVCSWSSSDRLNGTSVSDACTPTNFQSEAVRTVECFGGCETIAMRRSKGGSLDHFHRNCVQTSTGRVLRDRCLEIKGKILYEERCECMSDYCNSAPSLLSSPTFSSWTESHYLHLLLTTTILVVFSQVS